MQPLATDWPIDPTVTDGVELADILNRFAAAQNSSNSGATAPPSTYPGMVWLDTSGGGEGVLKIRNAANTAWIVISTPGGPTGLVDGTVAAPGLAFASEPGLGWHRPSAGVVQLVQAGAAFVRYDAGVSSLFAYAKAVNTGTNIYLNADPQSSANSRFLQVYSDVPNNRVGLRSAANGAGVALPMVFFGAPTYDFDNQIHVVGIQRGLVFDGVNFGGAAPIAFGWRSDNTLGVRIGTTQFDNTWPINIGGSAGSVSDERAKKDIAILASDTDAFMRIVPIKFRYSATDGLFPDDGKDHHGFSAQNLETVEAAMVRGSTVAVKEDGSPDLAGLQPDAILAHTVLQVQKALARIAVLEAPTSKGSPA